jgi:protein-tyrosine phosphatase
MAEAVFQHLVDEAGLGDQIEIDSAGTGNWHTGEPAHRGTRRVLHLHGIEYTGSARQIAQADFSRFDYILAMDNTNLSDLRRMMPADHSVVLKRFLDFTPDAPTREVPDPYYDGNFEGVYDLVRVGAEALLAYIRQEKGL